MPVKKNLDRAQLPPELRALLPDTELADVMIGTEVYVLAPLPAGRVEQMATELLNLTADVFGEINSRASGNEVLNYAALADALQKGISKAIASGTAFKIVSVALDLPEETVRNDATIKQLYHIAGLLWSQNFDMSTLADTSRKNVSGLLVTLGVQKGAGDTVYQWAEYAIRTLSSQNAGSPQERIALVMKMAQSMELIESHSPTGSASPLSPTGSGSTENTSPVAVK